MPARERGLALALAASALLTAACGWVEVRVEERPATEPTGQASPAPQRGQRASDERQLALEPRWRPLVAIVERAAFPGQNATTATTISPHVHVLDLQRWLRDHPPGSPQFEAVLLHEQLHARRQEAAGVDPWINRYLSDRAFMWSEEQLGWYAQLQHLRVMGQRVNAEAVAANLAGYRNLLGRMVSRQEAQAWVQAVLAGTWRPPS